MPVDMSGRDSGHVVVVRTEDEKLDRSTEFRRWTNRTAGRNRAESCWRAIVLMSYQVVYKGFFV